MHQACRILILFIVLFLVLIDLGRTAKIAKTSTTRTTVRKRVTDPLLGNQITTTTIATIPSTTIAKRQGIYLSRGYQITPSDSTTTSTTTTEKQMFDSSRRNQSIPSGVTIPFTPISKKKLTAPLPWNQTSTTEVTASSTTVDGLPDLRLASTTTGSVSDVTIVDCNINNFEYTSYQNSINVSWDDCGSNYNLELSKTIYDGPEIPYIRWLNNSSSYHFINLEDCTTYNVSIEPNSGIPFEATIRTLPEEPQDLTSTIQHGKITFNWSEPISEDCKRYSVILNDEIQPQLHKNAFLMVYNQSRCTRFEVALVDGENNTGGYVERMVPGEVQGLTATPQVNSITVTWEAPMDNQCIVGYTVILNEISANVTATEHTISNLEACTSHTVNVAVFSDTAYGKNSTVSTTTITPTPISAVQNLRMQVLEDILRVTWDPPNLQGACVTRYGIIMWNQESTTVDGFTTETFFEFTPLIGCMAYNVMVKPMREVYDGVSKTEDTIIPPKVNTPPTLASPVSIDKTSATITLSLQEYTANMCNIFKVIVNCTLEGSESIEISKEQDHTDSSTRTATVEMEKLLPHTNYICYAYVENTAGISNASDAIEFQTSEDLPSSPQALNVVEDEEGLLMTWDEPKEIPGVLGNYLITITPIKPLHDIPLDCEYPETSTDETSGLEYRYRNILANFLYNISVAVSTGAGIGPETTKTIETNPQAPETPQDVLWNITNDSPDIMLVITWKLPCKINGNLKHFEWILIGQHLENGNEVERNGIVQPTGNHLYEESINVLHYHNYTFRLAAYVQNGTDAIKGEDYVITFETDDGIPSAPQDLVVMQDDEGLLIIWKEPEEVLGILGNYSVTITAIGPQHNISEHCDLSTAPVTHLTFDLEYRYTTIFANYDYNISVAASTRAGYGPANSTTIVTDPEVPEAPRNVNLAVVDIIDNTFGINAFINWSEPCEINGELIYFEWVLEGRHLDNGKIDNRTEVVNPSEDHNYRETITNLLPYHNYTLRLAAYVANDTDEIKGEEYVNTFITVDGYPDAPTQLKVENVTSTGFNILWDEPSEKNGEILSYKIIIDTAGPNHVIPAGCPPPEYEAYNNYSTTSEDFLLQFTNGEPNFNYSITLAAETNAGFGKENVIEIVTKSAEPEALRDVRLMINNTLGEIYDARLTATWLQPCNNNGKLKYFLWILDGYSLDGETGNDSRSERVYPLDGEESFETIIEDLEPMFIYNLSLAACVEGPDEICGEIFTENFETPDGYASPPSNVTVRNVTDYSGILEWGEPGAKNGEIQIYLLEIISNGPTYYVPEGCTIAEAPSYAKNVSSATFEFPFDGLPSYNYVASVAAMTRAGIGYEGGVNFTLDNSPSQPPREVNYSIHNYKSDNYNASLTLTWLLPCNTYGKLRFFLWSMVGISQDGSYNFNGMVVAKEESEIDYKLVIDNLLPLHVYEFRIVAVVGDENQTIGEEFDKTFETPDGYPSKPLNLKASKITSELASIVWDEPQNRNGKLQNYRVVITSTGPVYSLPPFCSIDYEPLLHNVTIDPEMRSFAIQGRPNFHYEIVVDAATRTDYGTKAVLNIITLGAAPQSIENIKMNITDNKSESYASSVEISFDKPCTLHAMFSHYSINIVGKRTGFDDDLHLFSIDDFGNTSFPFYLQPEYDYSGGISVVTLFHSSTLTIPGFLSPAGVPPPTTSVPDIYRFTPNTASIILSNEMFDRSFGDIMYYAIIINVDMDNYEELGGGFQFLSTASIWPNNSYYGHEEYQATPAFWNPFEKRTTNYTYTIGNENCSANLTSYCNGPLEPLTTYGVRVRGFTSSGYRDTKIAYFTTPAEETYLALILGLIFGILAAIILLIFIFILWRRKRKEKEDNLKEDTVIEIIKPPPISKNRFVDHCLMFEEDRSLLKAEYSHLDRLSATEKPSINVAMSDNNKRKNRYINIMPYDETRVKLSMDSNENYEDYINASYIKGYSRTPEYIATQGPMESTLEDFWRMIIQENVAVIVMVAQFVEQSKQKCFKYFPEKEEIMSVGRDINVKCTNEINLNDYINRTLLVEKGGEQMTVRHLQYILWPDFGCPTDTTSMLEFREVVRKHIEMSKSKAVVHCSAGVGRTGTLIAIDILLQKIDNSDDDINVFTTVLDLRKQRTHMVQTEKQYEYIHKCLREYLTKPKQTSEDNLGPIYENVNIINGYANISRNSGPHTSTENLIRLKEL